MNCYTVQTKIATQNRQTHWNSLLQRCCININILTLVKPGGQIARHRVALSSPATASFPQARFLDQLQPACARQVDLFPFVGLSLEVPWNLKAVQVCLDPRRVASFQPGAVIACGSNEMQQELCVCVCVCALFCFKKFKNENRYAHTHTHTHTYTHTFLFVCFALFVFCYCWWFALFVCLFVCLFVLVCLFVCLLVCWFLFVLFCSEFCHSHFNLSAPVDASSAGTSTVENPSNSSSIFAKDFNC